MYLWCYEVSGVARRHQQPVFCPELLGKAEVTDPDGLGVPGFVYVENVARLKVPVDHLRTRDRKDT